MTPLTRVALRAALPPRPRCGRLRDLVEPPDALSNAGTDGSPNPPALTAMRPATTVTDLGETVVETVTGPAVTVDLSTPVLSALSLMTRRRIRHLPVIVDGQMVGFVSIGDLVKYRIDRIESEAEALRTYIQTA